MSRAGSPGSAWADGILRVNRAPAVLAGVWLLTVLVSLPLALMIRSAIAAHLGDSLAADTAAAGVNYEWMQEFANQATGLAATFRPTILGFGAVLDNLSAFLDTVARPVAVAGAAAAYVGLWVFLSGGIIDRYARDRATRSYGFFAACGVFFFRFLRLGVAQIVAFGFLFGPAHRWLFDRLYVEMIRDVTVERTAFFARVALYLVFGILVAGCNLVFDYAKVRAVVEDRRSMAGAIRAALAFVSANKRAAAVLYLADFGLFALAVAAYALLAPGATRPIWLVVAIGQLYVVGRLWVKLLFWASETALFQQRLAHAGYVARPQPVWPDSPAAEAIRA